MTTLKLDSMQTAAILADKGPLGRHARQDLAHKLPQGPTVHVLDPDGDSLCIIDTGLRQAFLTGGAA